MGARPKRAQRDGPQQKILGLLVAPLLHIHSTQVRVRARLGRVRVNRMSKCRFRRFALAALDVDLAAMVPKFIVRRIYLQGALVQGGGLLVCALPDVQQAQGIVGGNVPGVAFQCLAERRVGRLVLFLPNVHSAELVVRVRVVGLERYGFLVRGLGLVEGIGQKIGIGQIVMDLGRVGHLRGRLLIRGNGCVEMPALGVFKPLLEIRAPGSRGRLRFLAADEQQR